jgi:hypothetical protein
MSDKPFLLLSTRELWGQPGPPALQGRRVLGASAGITGPLVFREKRAHLAPQGPPGRRETLVKTDPWYRKPSRYSPHPFI